jgi:hypothetical protein
MLILVYANCGDLKGIQMTNIRSLSTFAHSRALLLAALMAGFGLGWIARPALPINFESKCFAASDPIACLVIADQLTKAD